MEKLGEFTTLLSQLAEKIGTTVEKAWPHMVAAHQADVWVSLGSASLVFAVSLAVFLWGLGQTADQLDEYSMTKPLFKGLFALILGGLSGVISLVALVSNLGVWVRSVVDPSGSLILRILGK